eukprot:COSAG01_NODE_22720_length_844_cov_1.359732_1_plen_29_part_10
MPLNIKHLQAGAVGVGGGGAGDCKRCPPS